MAGLLQFKRLTSATVKETFQLDGVGQNLDSGLPTVTLTRPDGTAGPASGTVASLGAGVYSFVLAGQPEPTILDVTWTGTIGGQPQTLRTTIEIVGDDLFTISELRALKVAGSQPFSSTATPLFTDAQIMDARAATLDEFTRHLGFSPVPRFRRKVFNGDGSTCLNLPTLFGSRVLSVTINGVAQTATNYQINDASQLESVSGYGSGTPFTWGRRNIAVEWVHGWGRVEGVGSHMAMIYAAADLDPSGFSNGTTVTTPDGMSYTYEPSEVGRGGFVRHTGIRVVDRWLNSAGRLGAAVA